MLVFLHVLIRDARTSQIVCCSRKPVSTLLLALPQFRQRLSCQQAHWSQIGGQCFHLNPTGD